MADTDPLVLSEPELSLLPLEIARQLLFSRYVMVGTAAVFIWDILSNLRADYTLLFKRKLAWPVAAYFLSRITSAAAVIACAVFLTYPVEGCRSFHLGFALLYPVAIPSTSLLFFFRVRAIYGGTRAVTIIFGLMWIAVLATSIIIPIATIGVNIGPSRYCILAELAPYAGAVGVTPGLFDTAVFVAISYRLVGNTHVEYNSFKQKARAFVTGAYLPSLSRSLFVDGQVYYMITVISTIASFLLVCLPGVAIAYRSLLAIPNVMLNNVMACHLYRHTRLELAQQSFLFPTVDLGTHSHSLHFGHTPPRGVKDCEVASERQDALHEIGDSRRDLSITNGEF
ncbi:hypothetical protein K438DRAFT_1841722 [Mycena galopus ATCC 62051]|nr:hypothetical protein K438DRAFT_1841722 [Mycena galopus ATCC 62051]